jgi:hypothetical protein
VRLDCQKFCALNVRLGFGVPRRRPPTVRRTVRACREHETLAGWALTGSNLADVGTLVEAERKLAALTIEHGRVKGEHAALTLERSALIVKQDDLRARIGDLERAVTTAEIALNS